MSYKKKIVNINKKILYLVRKFVIKLYMVEKYYQNLWKLQFVIIYINFLFQSKKFYFIYKMIFIKLKINAIR